MLSATSSRRQLIELLSLGQWQDANVGTLRSRSLVGGKQPNRGQVENDPVISVSLFGPLKIVADGEIDLTPRSAKAKGLVALLLLSKEQRRSRAWLQDKLWSDRDPEKGSASLRQALSDIRRCLGAHRNCLITQHDWVQLDPKRVHRADRDICEHQNLELCEGLDIQDPEFEIWLRDQRLSFSEPGPSRPSRLVKPSLILPVLVIGLDDAVDPEHNWIFQILKSDIVRTLLEFSDVRIIDLQSPSSFPSTPGPGIYLRVSVHAKGERTAVVARIETLSDNWTMWQSPAGIVETQNDDQGYWQLTRFAQICAAKIQDEFERQGNIQNTQRFAFGLANTAIRTLFRFEKQDLIEADHLLKAAYDLDPRGVYLSWRAFVRNTALFEHLDDGFLEPCEGYDLHASALADDPLNSYALVFAAQHSFVHDGDPIFGQMLCDRALEINPGNPLGWAFRSNMLIQQNRSELAVHAAERGMMLAYGLPYQATLALNAVMANIADRNLQQAIRYGRLSQLSKSKCQAIRRFLFVIFKSLEMPLDADKQLAAIRSRELAFEPEDLLRPDYPTWTLQKLPIAESLIESRS